MEERLSIEDIGGRLRASGLKVTNQRIAVYRALALLGHASVDSIVSEVRRTLPVVTVAAVYNILETMAESGLIGRVLSTGRKIYDITPAYHDHLIVDDGCEVVDLEDPEIRRGQAVCGCRKNMMFRLGFAMRFAGAAKERDESFNFIFNF